MHPNQEWSPLTTARETCEQQQKPSTAENTQMKMRLLKNIKSNKKFWTHDLLKLKEIKVSSYGKALGLSTVGNLNDP